MKDTISIIIATIIGTFFVVIFPLYSLADRQDNMAYNIVLTATTNFVDKVRTNGFIDEQSYTDYMNAIASTGNIYNVSIEAYRSILVPEERDSDGNVKTYGEQKILYNTQDIFDVWEDKQTNKISANETNIKDGVYLLKKNDEIYVKVYNTNKTIASILRDSFSESSNSKIVNISYGGAINNVNWELYNKIQASQDIVPEVILTVPVNKKGETNIQKESVITESSFVDELNCDDVDIDSELAELCEKVEERQYVYQYDLSDSNNTEITILAELRNFDKIDTGNVYTPIKDLVWSSDIANHIISNYIKLNGMYANIALNFISVEDYYQLEIKLTNVHMSVLDYIAADATVTVLPGLGEDKNGIASLAAETVAIELFDENSGNHTTILGPYNWKKLVKTNNLAESRMVDNTAYVNDSWVDNYIKATEDQEICFIISFPRLGTTNQEAIKEKIEKAIKNSDTLKNVNNLTVESWTDEELYMGEYRVDILSQYAERVLVKFAHTGTSNNNYFQLEEGWAQKEIERELLNDIYIEEEGTIIDNNPHSDTVLLALAGAKSNGYKVLEDDKKPFPPSLVAEGVSNTVDDVTWYRSDVTISLAPSTADKGGSGVWRNVLQIQNALTLYDSLYDVTTYPVSWNGTRTVRGYAEDYVGNESDKVALEVKIDKNAPTSPTIAVNVSGYYYGSTGWYLAYDTAIAPSITIKISNGSDTTSGFWKTTYEIEGPVQNEGVNYNSFNPTSVTLTEPGEYKIIARTYDKAGNYSESTRELKFDKSNPKPATLEIIEGGLGNEGWYITKPKVKITVDTGSAASGYSYGYLYVNGVGEKFTTFVKEKDLADGQYTLYATTYTQAGKSSTSETRSIKVDTTPPALVTSVAGQKRYLDYTEYGSGFKARRWQLETSSGISSGTSSDVTLPSDGKYELTIALEDKAGNIGTTVIDKLPPMPATLLVNGQSYEEGKWYNQNVALSYTGGSDNSGEVMVTLSRNEITSNTSGTKVTITTKDSNGNSVLEEKTIKLDKTAPTGTNMKFNDIYTMDWYTHVYSGQVKMEFIAGSDNLSGFDRCTYELVKSDGTHVISGSISNAGGSITKTITEKGTMTATIRTYDIAGNVEEVSRTFVVN